MNFFQKALLLVFLFGYFGYRLAHHKQQKPKTPIQACETISRVDSAGWTILSLIRSTNNGCVPVNCIGDYQFSPQFLWLLK